MGTRYVVATVVVAFLFLFTSGALAQTAEGCGVCHSAIYKEWSASPHASSWSSPYFQEQMTTHGSQEFCGQCHAPVSIWQQVNLKPDTPEGSLALPSSDSSSDQADYEAQLSSQPAVREHELEEGVYCGSCHFIDVIRLRGRGSDYIGPYHTEEGHEGRQVDAFREYRLCAACHGRNPEDYQPLDSAGADYHHLNTRPVQFDYTTGNCGSCHMPQRKEKLVQLNIFKDIPERAVGSHTFTGVRYERLAEALDFSLSEGQLVVRNNGIGHPLKVSSNSSYRIDLTTSDGETVHTIELDDARDLVPGTTSTYALPVGGTGQTWFVELFHIRNGEEARSILNTEVQ